MGDTEKRIIRSTKELPDWFDLNKYQGAIGLDAASWYEILLQRWNHFFWLDLEGAEKYKSDKYNGKNPFYEALLQSREDPLSLLKDDIQIMLIGGGQLEALKFDKKYFSDFSHAIQPLTARFLYKLERRLKKSVRNRIRKWMDYIFDSFANIELTDQVKTENEWVRLFIDKPIFEISKKYLEPRFSKEEKRGYDLVSIDLTLPDKILIEQFIGYLQQVRKNQESLKAPHEYRYPEYMKWLEYGVLPYIDLTIWAKENGLSIPYRVMADAILSDSDMGEEAVRKTTKKIADQLMCKEYIDFLATIAAQEIAEKI